MRAGMCRIGFPREGVTWEDMSARPTNEKTGQAGASTPGLLALPPSKRRFHMSTPRRVGSPRVSPGWRAHDLTPHDVAPHLNRFISYFEPGAPDDCWLWQGSRTPNGYGIMSRGGRSALLVHRVSWVAFTGAPLTDNLTIDHLCFTKLCVNPGHLEPVSLEENLRRMRAHYGYQPRTPRTPNPNRKTPVSRLDMTDDERRLYVNALVRGYYQNNRDEIRAKRREQARGQTTCETCGLDLRRDGLRRHLQRKHSEAA